MKDYRLKLKKLFLLSLAESLKICVLAAAGWIFFYFVSRLFDNLGLAVLPGLLKMAYLVFLAFLLFLFLRPMARTLAKTGFSPAFWLMIFMVINLAVFSLISLWLAVVFGEARSLLELMKGPFDVVIYLG